MLSQVQLALLTAAVKLFIYKSGSESAKEIVHKVLKWATEDVDNPDLRDRGFMYWRMLAINPSVAGEIVLAEKPPITTDSDRMDRGALDQLLLHTGTISSIYHKNPEVSALRKLLINKTEHVLQTFIRNAVGKALIDSPALNPNSRAVLVALPRPQLPDMPIVVPGPGPQEPHLQKRDPPLPASLSKPLPQPEEAADDDQGEGESDHDDVPDQSKSDDPYSNLGDAFKDYMTDQPRPIITTNRQRHADEDLLF